MLPHPSSPARARAKRIAQRFGITTSAVLWRGLAAREYRRKLQTDVSFQNWFEGEGAGVIDDHWAHYSMPGDFNRMHVGSQIYEITEQLRRRLGPLEEDIRLLDVGASDGFFMARLGVRDGVGVNFLSTCAQKIRSDGFDACVGDAERLPFPDRSFDYVVCCETLEHVLNPIATINELARVCRGTIHITIPWLSHTRINAQPSGWPDQEGHIFEFDEADFARMITHAKVRVRYKDRVQVFPQSKNPIVEAWLRAFMYPSFFPKLQYYELEPVIAASNKPNLGVACVSS